MAIVRLGPIVAGISGALGGVVFVNSKRSLVARRPPTTRRKSSPFLARSRSRMALLQNHWSTLTTAEQTRWTTAATQIQSTNAIGLTSPISGFEYYIKTNKVAFPGAFSVVDEPDALVPSDFVNTPSAIFSASGIFRADCVNTQAPNFLQMQVYGWPFWVDHETRSSPRLVFLAEVTSDLALLILNVKPAWLEHFGNLTEGQRVAVGIKARLSASPFNPMAVLQITVLA